MDSISHRPAHVCLELQMQWVTNLNCSIDSRIYQVTNLLYPITPSIYLLSAVYKKLSMKTAVKKKKKPISPSSVVVRFQICPKNSQNPKSVTQLNLKWSQYKLYMRQMGYSREKTYGL